MNQVQLEQEDLYVDGECTCIMKSDNLNLL